MDSDYENSIINAVIEGLDRPGWRLSGERNGIQVFSMKFPGSRYVGYKTVSEYPADLERITSFLGDNITTAMSMMNHRYLEGSLVEESGVKTVRTAFSMPLGFKNRDFVHRLYVRRIDSRTAVIAYGPVASGPENREAAGFVRCPMFPSGQRIISRGRNEVSVEHLMIYGMGGLVPAVVQNVLFHKGHVQAYLKEWGRLKQLTKERVGIFGNE
jgi:hypothetical protein